MDLLDTFHTVFPVRGGNASIELVELVEQDDALSAVVRLIVWDIQEDTQSIRDVKEQQVYLGSRAAYEDPRLQECLAGWEKACVQLFEQDRDPEWINELMPADLVLDFSELLALKRPRTSDDFAEALLASKQRLGQYLKA